MSEPRALPTDDDLRDALRSVMDPEAGLNIIDLGLIYGIDIAPERIDVRMTMTTAACPLADSIMESARAAIRSVAPKGTQIDIELVWDPPWNPGMMSEIARDQFGWPGN